MKTKKIVIAVLTAALVMAFIIGCIAPIDSINPGTANKDQTGPQITSDGKILVRLNLVDSKGRTVVPNTAGFSFPTGVDHFTLSVTDSLNVSQPLPAALANPITGGSAGVTLITSTPIPLAPEETYKFTVTAFTGAAATTAVAIGEQNLAVDSSNFTLSIVLKEIIDGSGKGTLNVAGINGYDSADLTLTPLTANGTSGITHNLNLDELPVPGTAYSGLINSGYYLMVIALTQSGHEGASLVEVVHIYENFTTSFSGPYPTLRVNEYTITYDDDAGLYQGMADETVHHGDPITNLNAATIIPSSGTDVFGGWYTTKVTAQQTPATRITGANKIIKALDLWIKWEPSVVDVDVSGLTNAFTGQGIVPVITGTATYSQGSASITITLTVTNDDYSSFSWRGENGSELTTTATQTVTGQGTASITIVAAQADASNWYQAGTHRITLVVTETISGAILSGTSEITCNP
jgi:hypothetical protein